MCLQLTLHNAEANTTENYDLFRTVISHTFHNLSPSTAYSLAIIAINKAGSGPHVSVNVTTQGAPSGNRPCVNYVYLVIYVYKILYIYVKHSIIQDYYVHYV